MRAACSHAPRQVTALHDGSTLRRLPAPRALARTSAPPGTGKDFTPEISPAHASIIIKARDFIETSTGFGTEAVPEAFSEEFVFRGPVIGPLCKKGAGKSRMWSKTLARKRVLLGPPLA